MRKPSSSNRVSAIQRCAVIMVSSRLLDASALFVRRSSRRRSLPPLEKGRSTAKRSGGDRDPPPARQTSRPPPFRGGGNAPPPPPPGEAFRPRPPQETPPARPLGVDGSR